MAKLTRISAILFSAALILSLPYSAKAYPLGTVEIVNTGNAANETISVWGGGQDGLAVYAGVYTFDKTGGTGEGKLWGDGRITAFCTELSEMVPEVTTKYDVIPLQSGPLSEVMGTVKAGYISELWGRYYDPGWASDGPYTWLQNAQAAAFATAIWEIIYEDLPTSPLKWDVTIDNTWGSGGFSTDFNASSIANKWLHSLDGTGPMADLRVFSYDGSQDYIAQVPEPATLALLGLGGAVSLLRRKRNGK